MSKSLKNLLIVLVLAIVAAVVYFMFFANSDSAPSTTASPLQTTTGAPVSGLATTDSNVDAEQIGQEFLNQLLNIRSIKLREDVFSRPAFVSLTDFTIDLIQPGNEGRDNPFAPFGVDQNLEEPTEDLSANAIEAADPFFGPGSVTPIGGSDFEIPEEDLLNS